MIAQRVSCLKLLERIVDTYISQIVRQNAARLSKRLARVSSVKRVRRVRVERRCSGRTSLGMYATSL